MATSKDLRDIRRHQARDRRAAKEQQLRVRERMQEVLKKDASEHAADVRRHNAVITGMIPRIAGAIDSWAGKRVPLSVQYPAVAFMAATDFQSIDIHIPEVEDVNLDFAADLRGLAYHEAGHILKSVPFPVILDQVLPESGAPQRRKFMEQVCGVQETAMHRAWNMLEDQRMESAMVRDSRNLGRYYNVIVLTHVLQYQSPNSYALLYGRKHVDATVRASARVTFAAENGEAKTIECEHLIDQYKQATTLQEMWETVVRFGRLLGGLKDNNGLDGIDQHAIPPYGGEYDNDDYDPADSADSASPDKQNESDQASKGGQGDQDTPDTADDEGNNKSDDKKDGEPEQGDTADRRAEPDNERNPNVNGASKSTSDPDWGRKLIKDALNEAKEERRHDQQIVRDVRAYNDALDAAKNSLAIDRIPYTADPDPEVTAKAIRLNRALRNIMEQVRSQTAPSWQVNQRQGVLDVIRYKTRQAGDMEFFRNYAEGGDMHLPNMAVSVLLDGSGSMSRYAQELAICAFGVKSACDVVNVPCTVTIYDTDAYLLWDDEDRPLNVPYNIVPNGGTDPTRALDLIDLQKHDKRNHLVIIMTDGQWSGNWSSHKSLAYYQAPDRDMVLFYLHTSPTYGPQGADSCSLTQQIDDLQELPRFLMRYLMRAM